MQEMEHLNTDVYMKALLLLYQLKQNLSKQMTIVKTPTQRQNNPTSTSTVAGFDTKMTLYPTHPSHLNSTVAFGSLR